MKRLNRIGSFLFPSRCAGCYCQLANKMFFCPECKQEFEKARCVRPKVVSYNKRKYLITGVFRYDSIAGDAIKAYKFAEQFQRADGLGISLADKLKAKRLKNIDYITYVPMRRMKEADRGFCQTELLAAVVSEQTGIRCKSLLRKRRETAEQHTLTSSQRKQNLVGAFKAKRKVKGKNVVVIDDVSTTGSTLCECAKTLYDAGAKQVVLLSVTMV